MDRSKVTETTIQERLRAEIADPRVEARGWFRASPNDIRAILALLDEAKQMVENIAAIAMAPGKDVEDALDEIAREAGEFRAKLRKEKG